MIQSQESGLDHYLHPFGGGKRLLPISEENPFHLPYGIFPGSQIDEMIAACGFFIKGGQFIGCLKDSATFERCPPLLSPTLLHCDLGKVADS